MRIEDELTHDERALEGLLGELAPKGSGLNRDALMFHAGRQAVRNTARKWKVTSATLCLACLALSALVYEGRPLQLVELGGLAFRGVDGTSDPTTRAFDVPGSTRQQVGTPVSWSTSPSAPYLTQLDQVIRNGWDVLPSSHSTVPGWTQELELEWGERAGRTGTLRLPGDWLFGGMQDGDRS